MAGAPSLTGLSARMASLRVAPSARPASLATSRAATVSVVARSGRPGVGVLGKKAGMTQIFTDDGLAVPATVISVADGNVVTAVRTTETSGYNAVQVGYGVVPERKLTKPEAGHLKAAGTAPMRHLVEFKIPSSEGFEAGQALKVEEIFSVGDKVDVAGTSVGKGFAGTIKKYGFKRGLMTHGSKSKRQHGSIGSSATPSRVLPGLKMAGQMGNVRRVTKALEVVMVDAELGALVLKGSVPGKRGGLVEVTPAKVVGKNC